MEGVLSNKLRKLKVEMCCCIVGWNRIDLSLVLEVAFQQCVELVDFRFDIDIIVNPMEQQRIHAVVVCVISPAVLCDLLEFIDDCLLLRHWRCQVTVYALNSTGVIER